MTTIYEHPTNGYRVRVSDGACFVWTLLFGGLFFLARGNLRHFFIGFILACITVGVSWLIYPFFAASVLRTMYLERGYREVPMAATDFSSPLGYVLAAIFAIIVLATVGAVITQSVKKPVKESASIAAQAIHASAHTFTTVADAQQEAVRLYPKLGVANSAFNHAFLARYKQYQQLSPSYFNDPAWPVTLANEVATASNAK